jgi:hypothetical protein
MKSKFTRVMRCLKHWNGLCPLQQIIPGIEIPEVEKQPENLF